MCVAYLNLTFSRGSPQKILWWRRSPGGPASGSIRCPPVQVGGRSAREHVIGWMRVAEPRDWWYNFTSPPPGRSYDWWNYWRETHCDWRIGCILGTPILVVMGWQYSRNRIIGRKIALMWPKDLRRDSSFRTRTRQSKNRLGMNRRLNWISIDFC